VRKKNRPHLFKILDKTLFAGVEKRKLKGNKLQDVCQDLKACTPTCLEIIREGKTKYWIHAYNEAEHEFEDRNFYNWKLSNYKRTSLKLRLLRHRNKA
jgi:hypothetical protein